MGEGWETQSPIRLAYRATIRRVIEDHVHGPVELLAGEDVAELEAVLRDHFPSGTRAGYLYVCWRAEVNLALAKDGDACRALKGKVKKKGVDLRGMTERQREWVERFGVKVEKEPVQVGLHGKFFKNETHKENE